MTNDISPADARPRHHRWARRLAPVALLALVILAGVVYGMGQMGKNGPAACNGAADVIARLDPLVHGEVAALNLSRPTRLVPAVTFNGPDGQPTSLAAFRGKTVLLNLWATWCVPCRTEMPALDKLEGKLKGPDFDVVPVNVDQVRLDRPKAFLKEAGITNLSLYADPTFDIFQKLKTDGQALGLPTTILIDRNGCELGAMAGPAAWDSPEAEALIEAAKTSKPL